MPEQLTTNTTPNPKQDKSRIVQRRFQGKSNSLNGARPESDNRGRFRDAQKEKKEFFTQVISMKRVTKVVKGGKKMRMAVFVVMGDKKGRVGYGLGKGLDTKVALAKAENMAKKNMFRVNLKGNTIPHDYTMKLGAAKIWVKPAAPGTGIIAGGVIRKVLEVAGVHDILTKQLGSSNHISNAYATLEILKVLKV